MDKKESLGDRADRFVKRWFKWIVIPTFIGSVLSIPMNILLNNMPIGMAWVIAWGAGDAILILITIIFIFLGGTR